MAELIEIFFWKDLTDVELLYFVFVATKLNLKKTVNGFMARAGSMNHRNMQERETKNRVQPKCVEVFFRFHLVIFKNV